MVGRKGSWSKKVDRNTEIETKTDRHTNTHKTH